MGEKDPAVFYEFARKGDVISVNFIVVKGRTGSVDVSILDPTGNPILFVEGKDEHFTIQAQMDGDYCFRFTINSHFTSTVVSYSSSIGQLVRQTDHKLEKHSNYTKEEQLENLISDINEIINNQEIIHVKARAHREMNQKNRSKYMLWATVLFASLIAVKIYQIGSISRLFWKRETKI
ncbi:putative emp24/gp25L/p24 family/GOLD [Monocercomonoides exilis]|uniref:putative emp24/gp25L/p24 family/GOLD n=1 Tax=Monocercomonoides exilis TaxID=2049356 RepID=UPI00355A60CB|nr:putative emp24/gp25L/p24 family/GOLD [Monocercomonoides exilis]|eukprot:MONOS_11980.1-p1 / transcript=MONOS_11980.1 / gene=MONOS_11980 / organism=Monocercomonoides_exilis_PA203 / gene_product=unspecified product / transcript_product=unspecified product / location=Mono_scaffold00632:36215-36997(-) / protein_length=177 / sequence_SO=supercontig / SO=protein_coding / is_pseudo=false